MGPVKDQNDPLLQQAPLVARSHSAECLRSAKEMHGRHAEAERKRLGGKKRNARQQQAPQQQTPLQQAPQQQTSQQQTPQKQTPARQQRAPAQRTI